jgi:hypothetical protein
VGVIGEQGPCVARGLCLRKEYGKPLDQIIPVFIVPEDLPSFNPANHHVVQGAS